MQNVTMKITVILLCATLAGCSWYTANKANNNMTSSANTNSANTVVGEQIEKSSSIASNEPIGGNIAKSMDEIDKLKMSRALDKAIGKASDWTNENTGISYTVVPTQKLTINGNHFCRKYTTTAIRDDNTRELNGVACVADDGSWHDVNYTKLSS